MFILRRVAVKSSRPKSIHLNPFGAFNVDKIPRTALENIIHLSKRSHSPLFCDSLLLRFFSSWLRCDSLINLIIKSALTWPESSYLISFINFCKFFCKNILFLLQRTCGVFVQCFASSVKDTCVFKNAKYHVRFKISRLQFYILVFVVVNLESSDSLD